MFLIGSPVCYLATISAGSRSRRRPVDWTSYRCRNVLIYDADQFLYIELTMAMCSQNFYRLADFALEPPKDVWKINVWWYFVATFYLTAISHFAVASHPHHWIVAISKQFFQPIPITSEAPTDQFCGKMSFPFFWIFLKHVWHCHRLTCYR